MRKFRVICVLAIMVLGVSLSGCGGTEDREPSGERREPKTVVTADPGENRGSDPGESRGDDAGEKQALTAAECQGIYISAEDAAAGKDPADCYSIEITSLTEGAAYCTFNYFYYWGEGSEKISALVEGSVQESDAKYVISFSGYDAWATPITGTVTVDRMAGTVSSDVHYDEAGETYIANQYGLVKAGQSTRTITEYANYIVEMAQQHAADETEQQQREEAKKNNPGIDQFNECLNAYSQTISAVLTFVRSYTDYINYYYVLADDYGNQYFIVFNTEINGFTVGTKYDVVGTVYYGDFNMLVASQIDYHVEGQSGSQGQSSGQGGYGDQPALSSSFDLTYDAYIYDENTGLFFVANTASNGKPFHLDGLEFTAWEDGELYFVAKFANDSDTNYCVKLNGKLVDEDGDTLSSFNLKCIDSGKGCDIEPNPLIDDYLPYCKYVVYLDKYYQSNENRVGVAAANDTFMAYSTLDSKAIDDWTRQIEYMSIGTKNIKREVYAVYLEMVDYEVAD